MFPGRDLGGYGESVEQHMPAQETPAHISHCGRAPDPNGTFGHAAEFSRQHGCIASANHRAGRNVVTDRVTSCTALRERSEGSTSPHLAASIRPHQHMQFAGLQRKVDAVEHALTRLAFAEIYASGAHLH